MAAAAVRKLTDIDGHNNGSKQVKGETMVSPDTINRYQAGEAEWKIVCAPACCVGV